MRGAFGILDLKNLKLGIVQIFPLVVRVYVGSSEVYDFYSMNEDVDRRGLHENCCLSHNWNDTGCN